MHTEINNYWPEFYRQKKAPTAPTSFARFAAKHLPKGTLLDVGCGNGRDSYFLAKNGFKVCGFDPAVLNKKAKHCSFVTAKPDVGQFDIVYSRFVLHAMPRREVMMLLNETEGYFVAEARVTGDKPKLYKNHQRWFVDPEWLIGHMVTIGFEILYFEKGRGLAPYKGEDPLVLRIIAKKIQ